MRAGDWVLVTAGPFRGRTGYVYMVDDNHVGVAVGLLRVLLGITGVEPIEAKGVVKA